MTARAFYTLLFGAVMLITALSVGSQGVFLLGVCALIACALALVSLLFAVLTCRISQQLSQSEINRGESCIYTLCVSMCCVLPIAPLSLRLNLPNGKTSEFSFAPHLFGRTESDNLFSCPHVGVFSVGAVSVSFGDVFGLFRFSRPVKAPLIPVCVLPVPRETQPLATSPGEGESTSAQRAHADRTTPTDTRAWQEGDELKRVHWKLSMRRQELMVHTYETPQRPDALILLDLAPLTAQGAARSAMIDALTETCAGVLKSLLDNRRIARMPLTGDHPRELSGQEPQALPPMLHALAQESFSRPSDFSRVLLLASRRMRRTGSTAVITAALTPAVTDAIIALSRMGPRMRIYLICAGEPSQEQSKLLYLLETCGIETQQVSI